MTRVACLMWVSAGLACHSGPDVDSSKLLVELTASDISALCDDEASVSQARTVSCSNGTSVSVTTDKPTCEANFATIDPVCLATAGDAESCFVAFDADPCSFGGATCAAVRACEDQ